MSISITIPGLGSAPQEAVVSVSAADVSGLGTIASHSAADFVSSAGGTMTGPLNLGTNTLTAGQLKNGTNAGYTGPLFYNGTNVTDGTNVLQCRGGMLSL